MCIHLYQQLQGAHTGALQMHATDADLAVSGANGWPGISSVDEGLDG